LVRSDSMGSDNESRFARRAGTRLNVAMAIFTPWSTAPGDTGDTRTDAAILKMAS
jgi:hypothetical protein